MKQYYTILTLLVLFISCSKEEMQLPQQELQDINATITAKDSVITSAQALSVANKFFNKTYNNGIQTKSSADIASIEEIKSGDETLMYVINYLNGGFVIVSANTNYYPVLAYSDEGSYIVDENSPVATMWMSGVKEAIKQCNTLPDSTKTSLKNLWKPYTTPSQTAVLTRAGDLDPILAGKIEELSENLGENYLVCKFSTSLEDGNFPDTDYMFTRCSQLAQELNADMNKTILVSYGGTFIHKDIGPLLTTIWWPQYPFNQMCTNPYESAGCSTIAIAQIVRFHKFATNNREWELMSNTYALDTLTQGFIRDVKIANGNTPSSTSTQNITALQSFGYNATLEEHSKNLVKSFINANRSPVFMSGRKSTDNTAHAWVCDGLQETQNYTAYFLVLYINNRYIELDENPSKDGLSMIPWYENQYIIQAPKYDYFHMNWGLAPNSGHTDNGWFFEDNVSSTNGDYSNNRQDIFTMPNRD